MAMVDDILRRLLQLHPKIIDLKLDRMWKTLEHLGNPQNDLPKVIHVAGTNGKGSTIAYIRAMIEAAGLKSHVYSSPHLVQFAERIYLGGRGQINDDYLSELLEECENVNAGEPITFFEITTAAAFLAFSREPADYLLLETGLGGRLDATNVVDQPTVCVITPIDLDHQQFLGDTLQDIAFEKAGILKNSVPAIIGPQHDDALNILQSVALDKKVPLSIANQEWQSYEQHGRLVFQAENELLDLPLPALLGQHQITNAGAAIATIRTLKDERIGAKHIEQGLVNVSWPARLQKLEKGALHEWAPAGAEIWLDGGHNPAAGHALALSLAALNDSSPLPLVLIIGMLNTKDPIGYFEAFEDIAHVVFTIAIEGEDNALSGQVLANIASHAGLEAYAKDNLETALNDVEEFCPTTRILIGGSLYLAGHVLAKHNGKVSSLVSGTTKQ